MAIKPSDLYPAQVDTDPEYPQGKARNAGSFQDGTGTPLEERWVNDVWGFEQALLDAAAITPSGDPDTAAVSQYLEAVRAVALDANAAAFAAAAAANAAAIAAATLRTRTHAALHLREVRLEGVTITDTAESMGAISLPSGAQLALKSDHAWWVSDWSRPVALNPIDGIDTGVRDVARAAGGRIVACGIDSTVGGGGGALSYSDTDGATWTDGTDAAGAHPHRILYSPLNDRFVVSLSDDKLVWLSDDGTNTGGAFPDTGLADNEDTNGLAILSETLPGPISLETIVILGSLTGAVGRPAFRRSQDGGTTWTAGSQLGAGVYTGIGCLCGRNGASIYHAGVLTGGSAVRISISSNATSWVTAAALLPPSGTTFVTTIEPRILQCPDTGLLVVVASLASGFLALYASADAGAVSWLGPQIIGPAFALDAFAIAGGRLFTTRNDMIFAADGVL